MIGANTREAIIGLLAIIPKAAIPLFTRWWLEGVFRRVGVFRRECVRLGRLRNLHINDGAVASAIG
jgi:hypothetical protein